MRQTSPVIVFVGVHREAVDPFRWLLGNGEQVVGLVTLEKDAMQGVSGAVDLEPLASAAGVPAMRVRKVNDPACVAWIRALEPDLLLVVGWTQLVKEELLKVPRIACLGFHASLLPKYRGRAPVNWALINGERETGNTMIILEPGADVGDIVAQRRIPIEDDDDCGTLYEKVAKTEVDMLAEILPLIREGDLPRRKQDDSQATVMPKRRPEDGIIDWNLSAPRLHDWVRALTHPYPGAFAWLGGRKVFVWKTDPTATPTGALPALPRARSGALSVDDDGWPLVATGDGWLRIVRAQLEGEEETDGREAARRWLKPGMALDREVK